MLLMPCDSHPRGSERVPFNAAHAAFEPFETRTQAKPSVVVRLRRVSERSQFILLAGIALAAALLVLAATPTFIQWSFGRLTPRELFSATSPDGAHRLEGIVHIDLPVNHMLHPAGTLRITLSNSRTGRHLDQLVIGLYEVDDFQKPTIVWEPGGRVHVQDIEGKGHRLSATLDIHQWKRRE